MTAPRGRSLFRVRLALAWSRFFARLVGPGDRPGDRHEVHAEVPAS